MLLETLDIKEDDVIIFSKNIFNLDNNFKKIKKDEPDKTPISISYSDVCNYINKFVPKNIIIYRLLLNIKDFQIQKSFYGHFMNIDGRTELVYFDPVFAIKELEEYAEKVSYLNLRFRIQQVGLTTLNRKGVLPNYAEIYNIDLEAEEAKYQNDSVYVEAILSKSSKDSTIKNLEANNKANDKELKKNSTEQKKGVGEKFKNKKSVGITEKNQYSKTNQYEISVDEDFDYKKLFKLNMGNKTINDVIDERKVNEKKEARKEDNKELKEEKESTLSSFFRARQSDDIKKELGMANSKEVGTLSEIFKSREKLKEHIDGRENKKIILRLSKG